jgi:hypothetical protein
MNRVTWSSGLLPLLSWRRGPGRGDRLRVAALQFMERAIAIAGYKKIFQTPHPHYQPLTNIALFQALPSAAPFRPHFKAFFFATNCLSGIYRQHIPPLDKLHRVETQIFFRSPRLCRRRTLAAIPEELCTGPAEQLARDHLVQFNFMECGGRAQRRPRFPSFTRAWSYTKQFLSSDSVDGAPSPQGRGLG